MIHASVSHARNHLSALLAQVRAGETILITDRDHPVARLVPVGEAHSGGVLAELARLGLVRLPSGPGLSAAEVMPTALGGQRTAGAVDGLLQERSQGL